MTTTLPILIIAVILLVGGIVLIGWLTGRIARKGMQRLLRFIGVPAYSIIVGLIAYGLVTTSSQTAAQSQAIAAVSETQIVTFGTFTQTLKATGSLAAAENTVLSFETSAPVTTVNVKVGDRVKAGDVLAIVDTTALDVQVRDAQISLTQAQNAMSELTAPARDIDIKIAKADIEAAQASLSVASETGSSATAIQIANYNAEIVQNQLWQSQLNRDLSGTPSPDSPNSYSNQVQTASTLAQSQTSADIAKANAESTAGKGANEGSLGSANAQLVSAQASLDSLLAGPTDTEVRQAQITVETAQLSLDAAKQALEDAALKAPFDGLVAAVDIVQGEVPPQTGAITLLDTSRFTTTVSVDEKDISSLQVGQVVHLTIQAFSNTTIPATVTRIEPAPKTSSGLVTYTIEVTLNTVDSKLRPGMTTVANVVQGQQDNVIVIPNRFITTDPTTQTSTVKVQTAANTYTDVPVTIGAHTNSESVITSGIAGGQSVVILAATTSTSSIDLLAGGPDEGGF